MNFKQAFEALKQGAAIKLPNWEGYWKWEDSSIKMYCKDSRIIDIRETEDVLYTITNINSDEWEIVGDTASSNLNIQTFNFGEAIRNLKNGKRVCRKGWNGKGIWLRAVIPGGDNKDFDMGMENLPYIEMKTADNKLVPWLASQTDVFAEDYMIVN